MNKILISIISMLIIFLFCSINNFAETKKISKEDNNQIIELDKTDSLIVNLEGNITTGYSWILSDDYNKTILNITSSEYIEESNESKLGSSGIFTFKLNSIETGETKLKFIYCQVWNKTDNDETFNIKIKIVNNNNNETNKEIATTDEADKNTDSKTSTTEVIPNTTPKIKNPDELKINNNKSISIFLDILVNIFNITY